MKKKIILTSVIILMTSPVSIANNEITYPIVDTGVNTFYNNDSMIKSPKIKGDFYGQDANYKNLTPQYRDNKDGTITDLNTGLIWQKDMGEKKSFAEANAEIKQFKLAGKSDWRIPSVKELYSLIQFTGRVKGQNAITLFIDDNYFEQPLGEKNKKEREIDAQTWSSTEYVGKTMRNDDTVFGVNFVDGRIKGYPKFNPRTKNENKMYFRYVRGNENYGKNRFIDNKDGTISDIATGLMWQKNDSKEGMDWKDALSYSENLVLANHSDWRLPDAKELQSIVDYSRSVQTTNSPSINNIFSTTAINSQNGKKDYPYFWSSTTHQDGRNPYSSAVYISFGSAFGKMRNRLMDVHGAGSQRSDPKSINGKTYPEYKGPQGDLRTVLNYVRSVRTID